MPSNASIEARVQELCGASDWDGAATLTLRHYGPEILGYLAAIDHGGTALDDGFSRFSEAMWRGLPSFEWRSSLRTWLYVIARHSFSRAITVERRARADRLGTQTAQRIADEVLAGSRQLIESEQQSAIGRLRALLDTDEQTLLILRVDRGLEWLEIAEVLCPEQLADETQRAQAATRLRKRFSRVKRKVRVLAEQQGLLG